MSTVQTDYAYLMLKMEQHQKDMHNACLRKKWQEANEHAKKIDGYCEALMEWFRDQDENLEGKFQTVRMPQQEAV